jgi:hypothetical protein
MFCRSFQRLLLVNIVEIVCFGTRIRDHDMDECTGHKMGKITAIKALTWPSFFLEIASKDLKPR